MYVRPGEDRGLKSNQLRTVSPTAYPGNAWLSARNWNRVVSVLESLGNRISSAGGVKLSADIATNAARRNRFWFAVGVARFQPTVSSPGSCLQTARTAYRRRFRARRTGSVRSAPAARYCSTPASSCSSRRTSAPAVRAARSPVRSRRTRQRSSLSTTASCLRARLAQSHRT